MNTSGVSRWKLYLSAAIFIAALLGIYLWRDLHLSDKGSVKIPDIVVENINVERDVNGKHWILISPRVEHKDGIVYADSLDVTVLEPDGKKTNILSDSGTFTRSNNDLTLKSADGTLNEKDKKYNLKAGDVYYKAADEMWNFTNGVVIGDGKVCAKGNSGYFASTSGDCFLSGDCVVTWEGDE